MSRESSPLLMKAVGEVARPGSQARWLILAGLLVAFMALTFLAVDSGSPSEMQDRPVILTTLGTFLGPFTGAIARNGQSCCVAASWKIAAICGPILAVGILSQFVIGDSSRWLRVLRLVLWTCGWFAWFAGGPVSFMHAFS